MLIEIHFAWLLLAKQLKYNSLSFPEHQGYVLSEYLPSFLYLIYWQQLLE